MTWLAVAGLCAACGPSVDDHIEGLALGGARAETARQELLLNPQRAVAPLLAAIDDPRRAAGHAAMADVLVGLTVRIDDPRLTAALPRLLSSHPDPAVRATICRRAGLAKRAGLIDGMVQALDDPAPEVRFEALRSLALLEGHLSDEQKAAIDSAAYRLADDPHDGVRGEAVLRLETMVDGILARADQFVTEARLDSAEAVFARAARVAPQSWKARYRLARFYYDNGQEATGLQRLRDLGTVLDVHRVRPAPVIDGRLDAPLWARLDSTAFPYLAYGGHGSPSDIPSSLRIGYDDDTLYIGVRCADDAVDSLVATMTDRDAQVWSEESVEIFLDGSLDRRTYVQVVVNALGTVFDAASSGRMGPDAGYAAGAVVAGARGDDGWTVELAIPFEPRWLPASAPGDRWGANFARNYRDRSHSSQWVYTYGSFHRVDGFGLLAFE